MESIIALLIALLAGLAVYQFRPLPSGHWTRSLQDTLEGGPAPAMPVWRALLTALAPIVKYTPVGWARALDGELYWAQLAGRWPGWVLTEVLALHAALGGLGLAAGLFAGADLITAAAAMLALPFLMNLILLRSPARRCRRQLAAELPEFISMLAAETGADTTLSEALIRLSRGPGLCAVWFRRTLNLRGIGGLFTEGNQTGALREEALRSGDPDLIGLAASLDNIRRRGTGTRELLAQMAVSTAARYTGEASLRAEKVGSEIILPMIFFFFLPYVAVVLLVMAAPLLSGSLF